MSSGSIANADKEKRGEALLEKGWSQYQNGEVVGAEVTLLEAARLLVQPHALCHYMLAQVRYDLGKMKAAATAANVAMQKAVAAGIPLQPISDLYVKCLERAGEPDPSRSPREEGMSPGIVPETTIITPKRQGTSMSGRSPTFPPPMQITPRPAEALGGPAERKTSPRDPAPPAVDPENMASTRARAMALGRAARSFMLAHQGVLEALLKDPSALDVLERQESDESKLQCLEAVLNAVRGPQTTAVIGYEKHWAAGTVAAAFLKQCLVSIDPEKPPKWGGFLLTAIGNPNKAWPKKSEIGQNGPPDLFLKLLATWDTRGKVLRQYVVANGGMWPWSTSRMEMEAVHWVACFQARRLVRMLLIEQLFDHERAQSGGKAMKRLKGKELNKLLLEEVPEYHEYLASSALEIEEDDTGADPRVQKREKS